MGNVQNSPALNAESALQNAAPAPSATVHASLLTLAQAFGAAHLLPARRLPSPGSEGHFWIRLGDLEALLARSTMLRAASLARFVLGMVLDHGILRVDHVRDEVRHDMSKGHHDPAVALLLKHRSADEVDHHHINLREPKDGDLRAALETSGVTSTPFGPPPLVFGKAMGHQNVRWATVETLIRLPLRSAMV